MHPSQLTSGCQILGHVSPRLAQVFQPGLEDQRSESPRVPHLKPSQPRGRNPSRPASVQRPPGVPPARSARRSPRGDRERPRLLAGCGLRLRLARSRLAAPHGAPLAPTAAAQALDTATFIFLNALGKKAKAKRPRGGARVRGERGARAGSQKRGPRPRVCARRSRRRAPAGAASLRYASPRRSSRRRSVPSPGHALRGASALALLPVCLSFQRPPGPRGCRRTPNLTALRGFLA